MTSYQKNKNTTDLNSNIGLDTSTFHTDRAMDEGYAQSKQEEIKGEIGAFFAKDGEYFDHKSRTDSLKATIKNHTPLRFAFNSRAADHIMSDPSLAGNAHKLLAKRGLRSSLGAKTVEPDSARFYSGLGDISNFSIALDNYDFYIRHHEEIRTNLARVMLAKLDIDMNYKGTLEDILNAKEWASASGEEVVKELKNRLRQRGVELSDSYTPVLKLLNASERIANDLKRYESEKNEAQIRMIRETIDDQDPLFLLDDEVRERSRTLLRYLSGAIRGSKKSDGSIGDVLEAIISEDETDEKKIHKRNASELLAILSKEENGISNKNALELLQESERFTKDKERFISLHNEASKKAVRVSEEIALKSKELPVGVLAFIADEQYFLSKIPKEERERVKREMEQNVYGLLLSIKPIGVDEDTFIHEIKGYLKSTEVRHIYRAENDGLDPMRQFMPYDSTKMHNSAGNVLKDAIYAAYMKYSDEVGARFINKDNVEMLFRISCDSSISAKKPNIDEVNDLYNAISLVNRATMGEIGEDEVKKLLDSELFSYSTVLPKKEDREAIREFTSSLTNTTKMLKEQELLGSVSEKEMSESIDEMHYLNLTRFLTDRLKDDDTKPIGERVRGFIGRNFMQHNDALHDLDECMKSALNPTTNVETIPSLSKACIEKYRQKIDKVISDFENNNDPKKGWLAVTFFGALAQIMPIIAYAKRDQLNALIDEMNKSINREKQHVLSANSKWEKQARFMDMIAKDGNISNTLVSASHANDLEDEIRKEKIARVLMENIGKKDTAYEISSDIAARIKEKANQAVILDASALALKKERMAALRAELLDMRMAIDENGYPLTREETQRYINTLEEKENRLFLEYESLERDGVDGERIAALTQELRGTKEELSKLREGLSLHKRIADITEEIAEIKLRSEASQKISSVENKDFIIKEIDRNKERFYLDTSSIDGEEALAALAALGEERERIDERIYGVEKEGYKADMKQKRELLKQRGEITQMIEHLTLKAYSDKELAINNIAETLNRRYNLDIKAESFNGKIDAESISYVLDNASHLTIDQKRMIRSDLFRASLVIDAIAHNDKERIDSNMLSSYVASTNASEAYGTISRYGDTYIAHEEIENGSDAFMQVGEGHLGYLLERAQNESSEVEQENYAPDKAKRREALLDTISILEKEYGDLGGNFENYKGIASYSLKEGLGLDKANSALQAREREQRRR